MSEALFFVLCVGTTLTVWSAFITVEKTLYR